MAPTRKDHAQAAALRNQCRRSGVQIGTINALLAQLCERTERVEGKVDLLPDAIDAKFARYLGKGGGE